MRTRSPNFMNGVRALPCSMASIARRSAMHADPFAPPAFETVPEPMIVPADNRRVPAAWAMS